MMTTAHIYWLVPALTCAVVQQVRVPTTTTSLPLPTTNRHEQAENLVDRIEAIDVSSNQIVISTSKIGPAENAQVAISVVDLNTGEELAPMNLTGILLVITRGRYTINFLKPNTWYGIAFRAEQQHKKPDGPKYVDLEEHLVHTHREDGSNLDSEPIVSVFTKRFATDGKSLENLVLALKWEQHPDERPNLNTLANVTLYCEEHIKYKQITLDQKEIEKSVEVKLDNVFEVVELHNNSRQIIASITPKHCHKICWSAELYADLGGYHFQREVSKKCEAIGTVTAQTVLRDYSSYEVMEDTLTVKTRYQDQAETEERDAYVQLTAIGVPEDEVRNNKSLDAVRFKVFSTANDANFTLDGLEPGRLYAVQYTYAKQSPFAYAESRRFVAETKDKDGAGRGPRPTALDYSAFAKKLQPNSTTQPTVLLKLDSRFNKYKVGLDIDPFCRQVDKTHIWLDKEHPEFRLNAADVQRVLCQAHPSLQWCHDMSEKDNYDKGCVPNLCYTTSLLVKDKVYSMERECHNLGTLYSQNAALFKDSFSWSNMPSPLLVLCAVYVVVNYFA